MLRNWRRSSALVVMLATAVLAAGAANAGMVTAEQPAQKEGYTLSSALAIGGPDAGDDAYFYEQFGTVLVDADASGNVYVLDNGNTRIQVFDAQGNFVRSLGSEGEGPGEFQIPGRFSVNARGDVAVFDMGQARVSVLDARGKLLWDTVAGEVKDIAFTDSGVLLVGYGKHGPAQVRAYGANGEVAWEAGENSPAGNRVIDIRLGRQQIAPRLAVILDGSCFRTPQGEYLVQRFSSAGAEVASFRRPFERQKITEEDMAPPKDEDEGGEPKVIMIKRTEGGGGHGGGGGAKWSTKAGDEETMTFSMDKLTDFLPTHHPDTRGVLAWPDGRVWIVTAKDGNAGVVTDEWSVSGEWLRRFSIPEEFDWLNVGRDGSLYGVTHDDDDYPTVHRIEVKADA